MIQANVGIVKGKLVFLVTNANAITPFANSIDYLKNIVATSISKLWGRIG